MRLLPWLILIVLVIWALRKSAVKPRSGSSEQGPTHNESKGFSNEPNSGQVDAETMISCAHCQMYFPASEAVVRDGLDFCSVAHAEAH